MSAKTVDMIVAVHDTRRNIRRAIGSVLADADSTIRAFVVCHNLDRAEVEREIADLIEAHPTRVRVEELHDGVRSPSGPFNFGLAASDADYVGIMGSDDELDRGAIAQWRDVAERRQADAVIAKVVRGTFRSVVRSPPKRVWKTGALDFARDRLSYRSAPLGLMRREAVSRLQLELLHGARSGGDLPFVTRLWALGRVVPSHGVAAYVEHADAPERVTWEAKPVADEFQAIHHLLGGAFARSLSPAYRDALGTKLIRRNLMDTIRKREGGRALTADDVDVLRDTIGRIRQLSPRSVDFISIAQRRLIDELLSPRADLDVIHAHNERMVLPKRWDTLLPARVRYTLHPQAQTRYALASALIKVGASRYLPVARNVGVGGGIALVLAIVALAARCARSR